MHTGIGDDAVDDAPIYDRPHPEQRESDARMLSTHAQYA